jgi:hypothetical protein
MSTLEYSAVIFTPFHSITGILVARDQRLSDLLNDTRESIIRLRSAKVSRHNDPARIVAEHSTAVLPKDQIAMAFEPGLREAPSPKRLYSYVRKQQSQIFILLDGFEVSGLIHSLASASPFDIHELISIMKPSFLPVTQASVSFASDERYVIKREAIIVNIRRVNYIAKPGA